ncbi:MAG: GNAT family N-acetyltransferase [Nevskia sp.]|nr:GNAT family N-acetyltransferase [Nevskia sp.]
MDPRLVWRWLCWDELSTDLLYRLLRLRSEVFVVEQACAFQDLDGLDPRCEHLCGCDAAGDLLAYARLLPPGLKYPEASLGRLVTAPGVRRTGLGRELMRQALDGCRRRYPDQPLRIGAQQRLERFYAGFGFAAVAAPYLEDGIVHVDMLRQG